MTERQLTGFGTAFIGRGLDLSTTIQNLPRFLAHLAPVAETLAAKGDPNDQVLYGGSLSNLAAAYATRSCLITMPALVGMPRCLSEL